MKLCRNSMCNMRERASLAEVAGGGQVLWLLDPQPPSALRTSPWHAGAPTDIWAPHVVLKRSTHPKEIQV